LDTIKNSFPQIVVLTLWMQAHESFLEAERCKTEIATLSDPCFPGAKLRPERNDLIRGLDTVFMEFSFNLEMVERKVGLQVNTIAQRQQEAIPAESWIRQGTDYVISMSTARTKITEAIATASSIADDAVIPADANFFPRDTATVTAKIAAHIQSLQQSLVAQMNGTVESIATITKELKPAVVKRIIKEHFQSPAMGEWLAGLILPPEASAAPPVSGNGTAAADHARTKVLLDYGRGCR
jgi:hypothetical protein